MKHRIIKIIFSVILVFPIDLFPQFRVDELVLNSTSPGFKFEQTFYTIALNVNGTEKLFVGTGWNAHLLSLDINNPTNLTDHGSVGYLDESNVYFDNKAIKSLTTDGQYIYGASSIGEINLFFFNPQNSALPIQYIGNNNGAADIFKSNGIQEIYDAAVLSISPTVKKVFMGTMTNDGIIKIIDWTVNLINGSYENPSQSDLQIREYDIGGDGGYVNSVELIKIKVNTYPERPEFKDYLVIGTSAETLLIFDISGGNFEDPISANYRTSNLVTDRNRENELWILSDALIKLTFSFNSELGFSVQDYTSVIDTSVWKGNSNLQYCYANNAIFTHQFKLPIPSGIPSTPIHYTGGSTYFSGYTVVPTSDQSSVVSIYGAGLTKNWNYKKVNTTSCHLDNIPVPVPTATTPWGGGYLYSMAANADKVYSGLKLETTEYIYEKCADDWQYRTLPWGYAPQIEEMFINNDKQYCGLYSGPEFYVRNLNNNEIEYYINKDDLRNMVDIPEHQTRIYRFANSDEYIFMGTASANYNLYPDKPVILVYNPSWNPEIRKIADLTAGTNILDLAISQFGKFYKVYGSVAINGEETGFIFDWDPNSLLPIQVTPNYISKYTPPIMHMVIDNGAIYAGSVWRSKCVIRKYPLDIERFDIRLSTIIEIPGMNWVVEKINNLVKGNDGNIYGTWGWRETDLTFRWGLFYFNPNNIQEKGLIDFYNLIGKNNVKHHPDILAIDKKYANNKGVYIGTHAGKIYRMIKSDIQETDCKQTRKIISESTKKNDKAFTYLLETAYPNPFNPSTSIRYSIASKEIVSLRVYDILGKEVAILVNEEKQEGKYEVEFDGTGFASGIYFYRLQAGNFVDNKKMILMK